MTTKKYDCHFDLQLKSFKAAYFTLNIYYKDYMQILDIFKFLYIIEHIKVVY